MSINSIRLSAYGFRMEAVGSKKFIKRERNAFLEFAAGRVNETAQKLAEAVCAEPLHPFCNCAMPGVDSDQEHEKSKDTGKELNITHKYKKTFTLDELRALIRSGEIQNHVSVGDTMFRLEIQSGLCLTEKRLHMMLLALMRRNLWTKHLTIA